MKKLVLVDLVPRFDDEVRGLLSFSLFGPTEVEMCRVVEEYRSDPRLSLFGVERAGVLVALIGLELGACHEGIVRHLAVLPTDRRAGLGRAMIAAVRDRFGSEVLRAETDDDAVGFYQRCGFKVRSLGERYPGMGRFVCEMRHPGRNLLPPR
jgi:ribosomal protein S18 acetylase RimI-like enzyme